jgi:hypothetical protein
VSEKLILYSDAFLDATSKQLGELVLAGSITCLEVCGRSAHSDRVQIADLMGEDLRNDPLCVTVLFEEDLGTITGKKDGLVPLSPWSWTCTVYSWSARVRCQPTTQINVKRQEETPAGSWNEKKTSSCNKLILQIKENHITCYALCYALLRMRPLSISCAEGFLVISCGKVDYDKSGWRDD